MDDTSDADVPSLRECEVTENKLTGKSAQSIMLKQGSNNSLPPPPSSPNNSTNDNVSSIDNNTIDEHDLNNAEKRVRNKLGNNGSGHATKDDSGHSEHPKSGNNNSAVCSLGTKDEVANVLSVKKEERSLSPVSPVGFDTVNPLSSIDLGAGRRSTGKIEEPPTTGNKNEKVSSPGNNGSSCKDEFNTNSLTSGNGNSSTSNSSLAAQSSFNNNCLELMQHQNHVFVFSTQLANKAAESVLSGKFHSIIAYHCTQPQTKNFLDEFFIKNPMKITKMAPRNSSNMNAQIQGGPHPWTSSGPVGNMSKPSQKAGNTNKQLGFSTMLNANADQKITTGKMTNFTEGDSDADLMQGWDPSGRGTLGPNDPKSVNDGSINSPAANIEKMGAGMNDSIPFLQGRKIPDENLTPQQRQHREEQLAKLKKMNQFLFPENDAAQTSKPPGGENIPPGMGNMLLNVSSGPPLRNNMLQPPQKAPPPTICESENSLSNVGLMASQSEQITAALQAKTTPTSAGANCDSINANIAGSNNNLSACGPQASNLLISNSASEVSAMPINSGNGFNAGDDVISSMEWAKMQNQTMNRMNASSASVGSNSRSGHIQNAPGVNNSQRTQPPPPYHSTQRSASVPIATQSPNPSSPNNPTSNLSMPSPASAGVPGAGSASGPITNSPNMDMLSTTSTGNSKAINFTQEANSNLNRNRQLSSNPSTPLSHMSPKELEFNSNTGGDPQQTSGDNRFPSSSPNYNFTLNSYKSQLERPVNVPAASFIAGARRTDNLPLNPNSNRMLQGKLGPNVPFDPISSLAQMSQQLSCASSGPVGNAGNNNIIAGELGMPPSNIGLNHHQNVDGMLQQTMVDNGIMDGSGMIPGTGPPFGPNNINPMMMGGPMNPQHRLLNPKMCGGFNSNGPGNVNSGFHGMPPNPHHHRMRMAGGMNFNNFNVSPNVQVKASTPNTIQYMPVRSQNSNSNMRAPPSLDFLPRYPLNPGQPPTENHNPHGVHLMGMQADMGSKLSSNINSGNNSVSNNNGASSGVMGFFQHCPQEQEDMTSSGGGNTSGMINSSSHDMMRGIRPMLRTGAGSSNNNLQYGGNQQSQDPLDCGDMFGAPNPNSNPNQMFPVSGGKPGNNKMGGGMVMGGNNTGLCLNLGGNIPGLEHGGMPNMMGTGVLPNTSNSGNTQLPVGANNNMNYKSFVGPSSNDLKYAQQYHSFQQQLYATSTRSQQQNGNNLTSPSLANVQSTNSPFYNK